MSDMLTHIDDHDSALDPTAPDAPTNSIRSPFEPPTYTGEQPTAPFPVMAPQPPSNHVPSDAVQAETPPPGKRHRWRFVGGLATGVAVSAIAIGAVAIARNDDDPYPAGVDADAAADATELNVDGVPGVGVVGSVHELVTAVRPSIVAIHTTVTQTDPFGEEMQGEAAGSGFVLSADGYVVTNNHVIEGADQISVTLDDGSSEIAELVAADPRSDLAVLHIDRIDLTPLELGDSDVIHVGDPVVAIGNALDLGAEPTVTGGMVSAKDRTITEPNGQVLVNLMQTDAAISPGNSGGPLIDLQGRVVGINTAVAGQGQNIGFAIAIQPAKALIDQLREGAVPRHALLGVSTTPSLNESQATGAVVTSVVAGSGAEQAGIQEGDVITALDDEQIDTPEELVAAIARHQPGDAITITATRDGESQTFDVVLGAHDEATS